MYLVVSQDDLARLKPETRADLLSHLGPSAYHTVSETAPAPAEAETETAADTELNFQDVIDLTPSQVADLLSGINEKSADALRRFAEHGPVIDAGLLIAEGIENLGRFQAAITRRTRTITGNKGVRLFAWDEWVWDEESNTLSGHYAVTQATHQALKEFFGV